MITKDEAADEMPRIRINSNNYTIKDAFKAGVAFAEQWIKVEDELPKAVQRAGQILYSEYLLIKVKGYPHPFVGYYAKVDGSNSGLFDFILERTQQDIKQSDIIEWRPINRL